MQRHIQQYPRCTSVCGQMSGVNLLPAHFDKNYPPAKSSKKKTDHLIKQVLLKGCCVIDCTQVFVFTYLLTLESTFR